MTLYRVRIDIPTIEMEVEATDENFAVYRAIDLFWEDTLAYVDICPSDAEVEEIDDPEAV